MHTRTRAHTRAGTRTTAAVLVGLLALTACGADGGGPDRAGTASQTPAASPTPEPDATGAGGIAATWAPRLQALADDSDAVADCQQPSTPACATAIDEVMDVIDGLAAAIDDTGAVAAYPTTLQRVGKAQSAARTYRNQDCAGDPAADVDGSPCFGAALDVAMAPTLVDLALATDDPAGTVPED